jgi:hypothetical protein
MMYQVVTFGSLDKAVQTIENVLRYDSHLSRATLL